MEEFGVQSEELQGCILLPILFFSFSVTLYRLVWLENVEGFGRCRLPSDTSTKMMTFVCFLTKSLTVTLGYEEASTVRLKINPNETKVLTGPRILLIYINGQNIETFEQFVYLGRVVPADFANKYRLT